MPSSVTIIGSNGRIGQETARAFVAAGWTVTGFGRSNRTPVPGMRFVAGDAADPDQVRAACRDADVVVNALNLPYDKWDKGRAEAQLAAVLAGLHGSGKTLLFPGNIYNYGARQHLITPDTPQRPATPKGEIRVRLEAMLAEAAHAGGLQVLIIRAPDFYGPGATGTYFDLAMLTRLKSGVLQFPSDPAISHSWAYLPDLARAFVKVAEARADMPRFEALLFRGHFVTGTEMIAAITAALPRPVRVVRLPWTLLAALGLVMPTIREVVRMRYLWDEPHQLRDPKMEALLGPDFATPFAQSVAKTTRSYLPALDGVRSGTVTA